MALTHGIKFQFAEDAPSASGDIFASVGGVRQDILSITTSADGDYQVAKFTDEGRLYTDTEISSLGVDAGVFPEDSAHVAADKGNQVLAVRRDGADATDVDADNDYASFHQDDFGRLKVRSNPNVNMTVTAEQVGVAAGELVAAPLAGRTNIVIQNLGDDDIFLGPSGVTAATGIRLEEEDVIDLPFGEDINIFAITSTLQVTPDDTRVMELA